MSDTMAGGVNVVHGTAYGVLRGFGALGEVVWRWRRLLVVSRGYEAHVRSARGSG